MKKALLKGLVLIAAFALMGCSAVKSEPKKPLDTVIKTENQAIQNKTESFVEKEKLQEPPDVTIKVDDQVIKHEVGINDWNKTRLNKENTFITIMKQYKEMVPYIKLGKKVSIEFKHNPPDSLGVLDYVLWEDGTEKYGHVEIVPVRLEDGKYVFDLNRNFATMASSNSEDYKPGRTLRGFKAFCLWKNKELDNACEYGFIIRTDAEFTNEQPK